MEEWRSIPGFVGAYEVSNLGRVRSLPRKHCKSIKILKPRRDKVGYLRAALYDPVTRGKHRQVFIHRAVCFAFNGEPLPDKPDVNHIDGIKANNRPGNLEWTNDKLNQAHAIRVLKVRRVGGKPWLGKVGKDNPHSKPIVQISADGHERAFPGIMEAARQTGLSFKHISACCLGKRKTHGGYQWRFEVQDMSKSQIRQGDVFLEPIKKIADSFVEAPLDRDGSAVLAYGEATGHKHRFERAADSDGSALSIIYVHPVAKGEVARLKLAQPAHLLHEEHSPHEIPAGTWRVSRPYEYVPQELPRRVED
jgi:NUMOD4 motif/HNH endonuclease